MRAVGAGVTVWEICNCGMKRPYEEVEDDAEVSRRVTEGARLEDPAFCPPFVRQVPLPLSRPRLVCACAPFALFPRVCLHLMSSAWQ